ncbi:MAG: FAD-dependent oxidoreductase [Anaerolineales bacterium]|nr:FAD-dependent oxidoreductase [Anaerolineales bacterium]
MNHTMNRRHFLQTTTLGLAGLLAAACGGTVAEPKQQRVLIVGAGMAGLTAARALKQAGYDVLVLEGRDRLGGRIWTSRAWDDAPMDLGASWIHGTEGNPVTALAKESKARTAATSYERSVIYDSNGRLFTTQQERQLEQLFEQVEEAIVEGQDADEDVAVETAVKETLDWENLDPEEQKLVDFVLNSTLEQEYGGSTEELSTYWHDDGEAFDGEDVLFPDGYHTLIAHLADGIVVKLNQVVQRIEWGEGKTAVYTDTDTYTGDAIICTLPLGVLQAGTVTFTPSLPAAHQEAIDTLQMGLLNKCYLRFPTAFWPTDVDWLEYVPTEKGQWAEWVSFARPSGQPILLGFNAADFGREIEAWEDEEIVESAMETLRTVFGDDIPDPTDYQITRWASDPFAYGAYSFNPLGSTPEMRDQLAQSVGSRLFFAGEATERSYHGNVHGAYLSGVRAAEEVETALSKA